MSTSKREQENGPERTSNQGRKEASGGEGETQQVGNPDGGGGSRQDSSSRGGGSSRSKVTKGKSDGAGKKLPARRK